MNKHLDSLLEHAKLFDDTFVKSNDVDLFCANETLIKSYIIAKSVLTPDLKTMIIMDPVKIPSIQSEFKDIINKAGLDKKLIKYSRNSSTQSKDDVMVFKNDSIIYFAGHEKPADRFKTTVMKLWYISNMALDSLMALENIDNFKDMVDTTSRVIYNHEW